MSTRTGEGKEGETEAVTGEEETEGVTEAVTGEEETEGVTAVAMQRL